MGAGIAQVSIDKGYSCILKDATEKGLVRGHNQISKNFQTGVKRKRNTKYVVSKIFGDWRFDRDLRQFAER